MLPPGAVARAARRPGRGALRARLRLAAAASPCRPRRLGRARSSTSTTTTTTRASATSSWCAPQASSTCEIVCDLAARARAATPAAAPPTRSTPASRSTPATSATPTRARRPFAAAAWLVGLGADPTAHLPRAVRAPLAGAVRLVGRALAGARSRRRRPRAGRRAHARRLRRHRRRRARDRGHRRLPARASTASRWRRWSRSRRASPRVRVSLRSHGVDVSAVAALRGGGGHREAAGLLQRRGTRGGDGVAQFRTRKAALDGILLIDKPSGCTSHDVVARVRRCAAPRRQEGRSRRHARPVRHRAARRARRPRDQAGALLRRPAQGVRCTMRFGTASDTGDRTGDARRHRRGRSTWRAVAAVAAATSSGTIAQQRADDVGGQGRRRATLQEGAPRRGRRDAGQGGRDRVDRRARLRRRGADACAAASPARRARTSGSSRSTSARRSAPAPTSRADAHRDGRRCSLDDGQTLAAFEEALAAREDGDERIPGLRRARRAR